MLSQNTVWKTVILLILAAISASNARSSLGSKRTLSVTTIASPPYTMIKGQDGKELKGFIPDLLTHITRFTDIQFNLHLVKDGRYGAPTYDNGTWRWNGMVGELVNAEADVAAADLTVSYVRSLVVDFTVPFMSSRLKILLRKRQNENSTDLPATLADLIDQKYKVLVIRGGSTQTFLKNSLVQIYRRLWSTMTEDNFVSTLQAGVKRVRTEDKVAYMTESGMVDAMTSYYCDVTSLRYEFGALRFIALAVRMGSAELHRLGLTILKLEELGVLEMLRTKWWSPRSSCGK